MSNQSWRGGRVASILALVACLGLPEEAAADTPASTQAARQSAAATKRRADELFDQGIALYQQQRWAGARAAFLKAWELRPTYDLAANLGHTEKHLGNPRAAAQHFSYALRSWPITGDE